MAGEEGGPADGGCGECDYANYVVAAFVIHVVIVIIFNGTIRT